MESDKDKVSAPIAKKRKIIQIAPGTSNGYIVLYAVCDDGTLWEKNAAKLNKWTKIDDIPQN